MEHKPFVTAVFCMDGRPRESILAFIQEKHPDVIVDTICLGGIIKFLVGDNIEHKILSLFLYDHIELSVKAHLSTKVFLCAHEDCAGNPGVDQIAQLNKAGMQLSYHLAATFPAPYIPEVFLLYAKKNPEQKDIWVIEEIL